MQSSSVVSLIRLCVVWEAAYKRSQLGFQPLGATGHSLRQMPVLGRVGRGGSVTLCFTQHVADVMGESDGGLSLNFYKRMVVIRRNT